MLKNHRKLRRRQIDEQFKVRQGLDMTPAPTKGWIHAIREALGMSQAALGRRMGISKQALDQLERAETTGSLTVKRLARAADALDCELIVMVVPRRSLEEALREQARRVARVLVEKTASTMTLEQQGVGAEFLEDLVSETAEELIGKSDPRIWE